MNTVWNKVITESLIKFQTGLQDNCRGIMLLLNVNPLIMGKWGRGSYPNPGTNHANFGLKKLMFVKPIHTFSR